MSLSNSIVALSSNAATALNAAQGQVVDLYLVPTTVVYLGVSTATSTNGGVALTTAGAAPPFKVRVPAGSVLYAAPSSSGQTVSILMASM